MGFENNVNERAEAYMILSQFFLSPPDEEALEAIRQDFRIDSRESLEELTEDFDEMFSFPNGKLQPIESVFTASVSGPYEDVMRFYRDAGLDLEEGYDVVPDHLSIELMFMRYLIENRRTEQEIKFLESHIMNWAPYYCEEIIKQARTLFYREIAEIIKEFLESEYEAYDA